jgi:pimeloyl-ACP methyl ester carboxylesterase
MVQQNAFNPADYILPLDINGLSGRMLRIPAPKRKKREILFIYGHHTSLERIFGVGELLSKYGAVTVPDLPGFGGMDPFYKIGEKPTLDNMADYLASFIKLRYKNRRFTLTGSSLGMMIITRMLQKNPEIAKKVDMLISIAGFASKDDFVFKRRNFLLFRYGASFFSRKIPAMFLKYIALRGPLIRLAYKLVEDKHTKLMDASPEERKRRVDFEIYLWQCNDIRTYMDISVTMLKLNLTGAHVDLPIYHVSIDEDRYFDNLKVEQHMREIYNDFEMHKAKTISHSPSILANAEDAAPYLPRSLRGKLSKNP